MQCVLYWNNLNIKWASEEMRGDKEVVLAAVQQDGRTLRYASEAMQGDAQVADAACQRHGGRLA